jgi:hypothetical protein
LAKAYYGFVQSRDGTWHAMDNCHILTCPNKVASSRR